MRFERIAKWASANGYPLASSLPSNWDRYGDGIPSVTAILSLLVDESFEHVKRRHPDALKAACDRGTRIHSEADSFFAGEGNTVHPQIMKFHVLYGIKPLWQERRWTDGKIQGTIDLTATLPDGRILNVDYKSSMNRSPKYFLQLGGYQRLNGYPGGVLYLGKKEFDFQEAPEGSMETFDDLVDYFFYLKENDTGNLQ